LTLASVTASFCDTKELNNFFVDSGFVPYVSRIALRNGFIPKKRRVTHEGSFCSKWGLSSYGSPIFKTVQQKRCKALYTALTKSPTAPEDAVGEGSERSNVDWSVAVPQ